MIDRIFIAALTFCLLAAGTLALTSALFENNLPAAARTQAGAPLQAAPQVVQLPLVEVTGKRVDKGTAWARTEGAEPATHNLQ